MEEQESKLEKEGRKKKLIKKQERKKRGSKDKE